MNLTYNHGYIFYLVAERGWWCFNTHVCASDFAAAVSTLQNGLI